MVKPAQMNTQREWRLLADRDLEVAVYLAANMYPRPNEIISFHCQQAVEKYLKGVLVILGEVPPYTHDLPLLCRLIENHRPSFSALSSFCTTITHFSVQPRYDFGLSLSETDMQLVLRYANEIKVFLEKEFPDLFQDV
jgi:HEPN domain-containing protein